MNYEELQQGIQDNLPIPNWEELWEAIENSNLEKYTPKQIKEGMLQDKHGWNLYQEAAANGHLDQIPKEFLTAENLLQHEKVLGWNCLHLAARNGHLDQIPKELLTAENLLQPGYNNYNCLHLAAYNGHLDQIPKELLTAENLLKHDKYGDTCLHFAAMGGHLDKLPWLPYETLKDLKTHFEAEDSSPYKELILKALNESLEKKIKKLEIIARSQTINHDTDIL